MSDVPFGPFIIVSCELTVDPKVVRLTGPFSVGLEVPYDRYQEVRALLGLPELICPGSEI